MAQSTTTKENHAHGKEITFSRRLRASIEDAHQRAHDSNYMKALLSSELTVAGYTRLASQYHFIYEALEQVSDRMATDPVGGQFVFDELRRGPALARDLTFLIGPDWKSVIEPLSATESYVNRIHSTENWPGGYVAHHYTRYFADLSGGQIVRWLLQKAYGISGPGALFYEFERISSLPGFRNQYRELLDNAPWDNAEQARIVTETLFAFELNTAVFDELAQDMAKYLA